MTKFPKLNKRRVRALDDSPMPLSKALRPSSLTQFGISAAGSRFAHARKTPQTGAQGRIRTSVPRKEEQIYSLSALTTHPPVRKPPGRKAPFQAPKSQSFARVHGGCCGECCPKEPKRARISCRTQNTTLGKASLWSAVGKNSFSRRAAQNALFRNRFHQCWSWRRDLNP